MIKKTTMHELVMCFADGSSCYLPVLINTQDVNVFYQVNCKTVHLQAIDVLFHPKFSLFDGVMPITGMYAGML